MEQYGRDPLSQTPQPAVPAAPKPGTEEEETGILGWVKGLFHFQQLDDAPVEQENGNSYDDFLYLQQGDPFNSKQRFLD